VPARLGPALAMRGERASTASSSPPPAPPTPSPSFSVRLCFIPFFIIIHIINIIVIPYYYRILKYEFVSDQKYDYHIIYFS
jgi:hypothetical protein